MYDSTPQKPTKAGDGIWRDGNQLVVDKRATLPPNICVRTNTKSKKAIKRKFHWHHPAIFFTILLHFLVYIILALVLRKSHQLDVPLCEKALSKRKAAILICWAVALVCIAGIIVSIVSLAN